MTAVGDGLWTFVGPTEALLHDVQRLFLGLDRSVFLRSLDALHLVTARGEQFDRLYSNDRHLLAACGDWVWTESTPPDPRRA